MNIEHINFIYSIFFIESALAKFFKPIENQRSDSKYFLMACYRKDHFATLFIRTAR
jgi:hypothetical protein